MPTDKPKPADLATIQATIDAALNTATNPVAADAAWTVTPILEWRDGRYQPLRAMQPAMAPGA